MHSACRRHQHRAVDAIRVIVREFEDDRAPHRISDQGRLLDSPIVEELHRGSARAPARRAVSPVSRSGRTRGGRARTCGNRLEPSAVGSRYRPDRPKPCRCIITGASGGSCDSRKKRSSPSMVVQRSASDDAGFLGSFGSCPGSCRGSLDARDCVAIADPLGRIQHPTSQVSTIAGRTGQKFSSASLTAAPGGITV